MTYVRYVRYMMVYIIWYMMQYDAMYLLFLSEVDAKLPMALRKKINLSVSRDDIEGMTCSVPWRVTTLLPKMTKSKFGMF